MFTQSITMCSYAQIFHYGVAEQKGEDIITFNAVCLPPNFTMEYCPEEATLTNSAVAPGKMHSFVLHLDTRKCEGEGEVDQASVEFPTIHPYRHGHTDTRYSYLMASDRGSNVPYRDVIKVCSGGTRIIRMPSLRIRTPSATMSVYLKSQDTSPIRTIS